jgi:rhamnulokinase
MENFEGEKMKVLAYSILHGTTFLLTRRTLFRLKYKLRYKRINMKALALDLGGSSGKIFAGRFDGKKISMKEVHRFQNDPIQAAGRLYWDILGIYGNLLQGMCKAAPEGFASFGVDSFCNDYGLLDRSGALFSQVYMYRDSRTEGVPEKVDQTFPSRELYERTGCQRARFNTLMQLVAQMGSPDRFLLENAGTLQFVPDLLNYFLCGEKVAEYTIASVSQLYNRTENQWDDRIIQAFDLPRGIFPRVVPSSVQLGPAHASLCADTGAPPFSVCTVAQHDTASAVVAVPSTERHFVYISSGTWSLMGTETEHRITTDAAYRENFANEGGAGYRNRFLKNIMGLWLIQECKRQYDAMGIRRTFAELDAEAETIAPFRSLINPDDPLFFQPGDMLGKIQGKCKEWRQPVPETPAAMNRCIKESLALAYRRTLERLEAAAGFTVPYVHIIGGGARSTLLNRFTASAIGRPVLAGPYEAAVAGNLCAQFMSTGEIKGLDEARSIVRASFEIREFQPESNAGWDEAYGRFLEIASYHPHPPSPD